MPDSLRTAVIGGGYAGMAAALTLAERHVPVTVFEAGAVTGGRARNASSFSVMPKPGPCGTA